MTETEKRLIAAGNALYSAMNRLNDDCHCSRCKEINRTLAAWRALVAELKREGE